MVLIAFLLTWVGAGLLALTAFVLNWATVESESMTTIDLGQRALNAPNGIGLPTVLEYYTIAGYAAIAGLLVITTLFAMFNTRANRWIAVIGYILLAAGVGYGSWNTWGTSADRTTGENVAMFSGFAVAILLLLFAFFAIKQRAWAAALVGVVVALVGLGMSIWLLLSENNVLSFEFYGWLIPVGYLLIALGALCSIATSGQAKMREAEQGGSPTRSSGGFDDSTLPTADPIVSNPTITNPNAYGN